VWGYSGKNKKKNLQWRNQKKFHDQFSSIKVYNSWKKSNVLYLSNKTDQGNLKKKTNYINYFRLVRNYKYELFIYIYKFEHGA
jgi:hypothetical protein